MKFEDGIMNDKRNSSVELLRIVAMLMVVGWHTIRDMLGNGFGDKYDMLSFNQNGMLVLQGFVIIAVNCYVLITGYFSVNSNKLKLRKCFDIVFVTMFYGAVIYIVTFVMGKHPFDIKQMIIHTFPFFFDKVWFINVYIILILLSPFINIILNRLNKVKYQILLIILLSMFSIWATFFPNPPSNDLGYGIITFVVLYTVGGYLRLHYTNSHKAITYLAGYVLFSMLTLANMKFGKNGWDYNSILNILSASSLFMFFNSVKFSSKLVNVIAGSTLSVYIIHTHGCIRPYLFTQIFALQNHLMSYMYFVYYITMILIIFSICIVVDLVLKQLFKYTIDKWKWKNSNIEI